MSTIADVAQVLGGPNPYKSKHEQQHWTTISGTRWQHIAMHSGLRPWPDENGLPPRRYRHAVKRMVDLMPSDPPTLTLKNVISICVLALAVGLCCGLGISIVLTAFGY